MAQSVPKPPLKAKKSFGQHFLADIDALSMMAEAAEIEQGSHVLEIGPGYGTLTQVLAEAVGPKGRVLCIEKDRDVLPHLRDATKDFPQVTIVEGDALTAQIPEDFSPYRIVANIPYYITTPLIKRFLFDQTVLPRSLTLLVQKEYAERATDDAPKGSSLGMMLRAFGEPQYIASVPKELFMPPPKVDSAILHLDVQTPHEDFRPLLRFIQQGFGLPRKKLAKQLLHLGVDKKDASLYGDKRPGELSFEDWQHLFTSFSAARKDR
ncbi:ribosomal RNA small subunit methyltransferase A [Candidatus Gracilibacteria bacterium CG17_big_fil_post_rev_8_21_14_2_50_48_13]|nr:MAG: ribosomal RNA small subunit methyltransferase A [Candidatus Gracilibacteria bacterium CG17_big_fil_post_rev_8_21_14_2_50_48_13]